MSEENVKIEHKTATYQQKNFIYTDDGNPIVRGKLHRGRRWTSRENEIRKRQGRETIAPYSHSLGLCSIKFFWQEGDLIADPYVAIRLIPGIAELELIFQEEVPHAQEGDIFFSDKDGPFSLPIELSKEFYGEEESMFITILPENYIFDISEEYPYGHVVVNYELTKEEFVN